MKRNVILTTIIVVAIIAIIIYIANRNENYYGEIMDRLCMNGGCETSEKSQKAKAECIKERSKLPTYPIMKRACESSDPFIRDMGCAETCEPSDVASYILDKPELGCKEPMELGEDRFGNIYCMSNQNTWILVQNQPDLRWN